MIAISVGGPTLWFEIGGFRFLTDPTFDPPGRYRYLEKQIGPACAADALSLPDAVLLSHDQHDDNLDRSGRDYLRNVSAVYTTHAARERLGGSAVGLAPGERRELRTASGHRALLTAIPARHGPPGIEPVSGPVIGFLLSDFSDSPETVYVSGDTVWYEGLAAALKPYKITIAVLHLGDAHVEFRGADRLTMNADEGVHACLALKPKAVIPVHYDGWAHFKEPKEAAQSRLTNQSAQTNVFWLTPGQPQRVFGVAC